MATPIGQIEDDLNRVRNERRQAGDKGPDNRAAAERDRDRVLYSSAFRRLGGVTQVVWALEEGHLLHNRLTHSLKVAQIGQRIAQKLERQAASSEELRRTVASQGGLDATVVETAGLAHDLGHPPFGHIAEEALNKRIRAGRVPDGFEGNAQSFRIVTRLAAHDSDRLGLNLTRASLNAILKYPWLASAGKAKYGAYESERDDFDWARGGGELVPDVPTLEAQIMDWSDDITYAVHDLEDFYRAGLIPMASFENEHDVRDIWDEVETKWIETASKYHPEWGPPPTSAEREEVVDNDIVLFPHEAWHSTRSQRAALREFSSRRIGELVEQTNLRKDGLEIARDARVETEFLKQLTWHYVIENPILTTQQ